MIVAVELGLLYAVMALGVYLTYRVLDFPDLTVDGSFTTGAATCAMMIVGGLPVPLAMIGGVVAGMLAGAVTGLLHVWGNINALLAGILTQIALYSINLRIMGNKANIPLLRTETAFSWLKDHDLMRTWVSVAIFAVVVLVVGLLLYLFLGTSYGVALRATGDNELMARSQGINTGVTKIVGLMISNGMVGLCGALIVQYQGFADISMGIGIIVAGLASVIVGQAIFGMTSVWQAILAAVLGSIIYRGVIQAALMVGLNPNDMKLISAVLVVAALVLPQWGPFKRLRIRRRTAQAVAEGGK
ncbi:putative ABC transport system permease protein [Tessaracoccus bendigoensis DSM 12906]|uniref:Putative ABC transport system permease protein n=1 Tax=Tessaracoccus bendigoensis DSM 12906 TaxID=1123357 RepID=A0A1M6HTG9_9ACTN|nr:ABC transporter permease [Tessaracoccus bendigoensis]SHJ25491.1 putative ABC transport system permease protein [Tessaracoccus bendigoensis DSM 12906]